MDEIRAQDLAAFIAVENRVNEETRLILFAKPLESKRESDQRGNAGNDENGERFRMAADEVCEEARRPCLSTGVIFH